MFFLLDISSKALRFTNSNTLHIVIYIAQIDYILSSRFSLTIKNRVPKNFEHFAAKMFLFTSKFKLQQILITRGSISLFT